LKTLYNKILSLIVFLFITNCTTGSLIKNKTNILPFNGYSNKGFALVYSQDLFKKKIINKKMQDRSLIIFQKNLKINTNVKITNILNNKSIIGTVGKDSIYPSFNNAVLSSRIAEELDLDIDQPYVEILEIRENSIFVAQKAKTYEEEKSVAVKAPVNNISIKNLNLAQENDNIDSNINFSYIIKIADFYFNDTALTMLNRIKSQSLIKDAKIEKISNKIYRVYSGPFSNINTLQKSYNDISILKFENIEILKND
jgi:hypothetical protein|tara:strand:+ start:1172 stop:1936 length:765 start_codon:yes stop_codon:yes gene_type:complete